MNLDPRSAFSIYNLAPLSARRDIANSGVVYRAVLRRCPKKLHKFFVLDTSVLRSSPRFSFHKYQVSDPYRELHRDYVNRSTLGYISIFNLLPDVCFVMDGEQLPISVKAFQQNLTSLLRLACRVDDGWQQLFSSRLPLTGHLLHEFRYLDVIPE